MTDASNTGAAPALRGGASCRARSFWVFAIAWQLSSTARAQEPPPAPAPSAPAASGVSGTPDAAAQQAGAKPEAAPTDAAAPAPAEPSAVTLTARAQKPAAEPVPVQALPGSGESPEEQDEESIPGDPWGDNIGGVSGSFLSFRVLLQTRYTATFAQHSTNTRPGYALREDVLAHDGDGWDLNRFFLRVGADPIEELGFKAIIDFAEIGHGNGSGALKQAYAMLRPLPKHVEFYAGVLKLPFSTMELDPIASYELGELGPTDNLLKNLGFAGRDTGVEVMLAPTSKSKLLRFYLGAFRGQSHDEHHSPLGAVGGRVESKPVKGLRVGADIVAQPYSLTYRRPFDTSSKDTLPMPDDPLFPRSEHWASGTAYSADVTFERWRLMLRGEGMLGTRVDVDTRYGSHKFWAVWGLVAYRFRAGPLRLMPAVRAEWLDADREHSIGVRRVLDAGLTCFFTKQIRLLVDVSRSDVEPGSPVLEQPQPLPGIPYFDLNATRVIAQIQVEI